MVYWSNLVSSNFHFPCAHECESKDRVLSIGVVLHEAGEVNLLAETGQVAHLELTANETPAMMQKMVYHRETRHS
jgi:hypothetical protein